MKTAKYGELFARATPTPKGTVHLYFPLSDHFLEIGPDDADQFADLIKKTAIEARAIKGETK